MTHRLELALQRLRRRVQRALRIRSHANHALRVSKEGLRLEDLVLGDILWSIRWDEIDEIVAFKRDMLTVDDLCLGFLPHAATEHYVCDEEMPGWTELLEALETRFDIRFVDWFPIVAHPSFAPNWTVLWRSAARK